MNNIPQTPATVLDAMMADFLAERGYEDIAKKIDPRNGSAGQGSGENGHAEESRSDRKIFQTIPKSTKDAGIEDILQSYSELSEWVRSSLDLYKNELFGVLFPVFSHFFVTLAKMGRFKEAHQLLGKYGDSFMATKADAVYNLKMINSAEQVESHCSVSAKKTVLAMSQFAFNLLISFLQDNNLFLILTAINQNISVRITSAGMGVGSTSLSPTRQRQEFYAGNDKGCNKKTVTWGVMKKRLRPDSDEQLAELERLEEKAREARPAPGTKPKVLAKEQRKQNKELNAKIANHKKEMEQHNNSSVWIGENSPRFAPDYYNKYPGKVDWKSDLVSKLLMRATPLQQKAEETDLKRMVCLGYTVDHDPKRANRKTGESKTFVETPALPSIACFTMMNTGGMLSSMDISADGVVVAGGFSDNIVRLWRLDNADNEGKEYGAGHEQRPRAQSKVAKGEVQESYSRLIGHTMSVTACSISPDNQWLLTSSQDSTVRRWHIGTGAMTSKFTLATESQCPVWDVSFGPYGYFFVTGSRDKMAYLWSLERTSPIRHFWGHRSDVGKVRFHPNSIFVGTGSVDGTVRLWDVRDGNVARVFGKHNGPIHSLAFSPNGQFIASSGEHNQVVIWDLRKGARFGSVEWKSTDVNAIWSLDYSSDGTVLAGAGSDGKVRLWDAALMQGQTERRVEEYRPLLKTFQTKKTPLLRCRFSPRNILMVSGAIIS
eukprot:g919.t1